MQEIELKFLVPQSSLDAIKRQTHIKSSQTVKLAAHYFDTPNKLLANNGFALRIRKEGDDWVQTIKANGDGLACRLEHNHILDNQQTTEAVKNNTLCPDFSIYANTPIAPLLAKLDQTELNNELTCQYITDVERTKRLIKKEDNIIEVAFDTGEIIHGTDNNQRQPIQEVELELLQGDTQFLFDVAKTWSKRYKLNKSTITKAERGGLLLAGRSHNKATKADKRLLTIHPKMKEAEFIRATVHNCLLHIMPNASAIADGSTQSNHVHQLRVGLRRLRTILKFFGKFDTVAQNPEWQAVIKQTFKLLGEYRDREILIHKTQPMLEKLGSPPVAWSMDEIAIKPIDAVQANDFQIVLLELVEFALSKPSIPATAKKQPIAKKSIDKVLNKLFKRIVKDSEQFMQLDIDAQHDVRKQLKSLRYICEFVAPVYDTNKPKANKKAKKGHSSKATIASTKGNKKESSHFLAYLKPAQNILGKYNDKHVGYQHYLQKTHTEANAWFAVGWFLASEQQSMQACANSLASIKNAPKFW